MAYKSLDCLEAVARDFDDFETVEAADAEGESKQQHENNNNSSSTSEQVVDYTQIPKELDRRLAELDVDGCLRPTIINVVETWEKRSQPNFLTEPTSKSLP